MAEGYGRQRHLGGVDQHLDPRGRGVIKRRGEPWIQFGTGPEALAVGALDDEQYHGALTGGRHGFELAQVLRRPSRHAVGKLGQALGSREVAVLDLQPAGRSIWVFQQEVDAGGLAYFTSRRWVA